MRGTNIKSINTPFNTILDNAVLSYLINLQNGEGIDVTWEKVDMIESWHNRSSLVTKSALKNAVSVVVYYNFCRLCNI